MEEKVAEAGVDLAICYWREGGYDEARITLQQILQSLGDRPSEQKLRALLNCGLVERSSLRYHDAPAFIVTQLRFLTRAVIMRSEVNSTMSLPLCSRTWV